MWKWVRIKEWSIRNIFEINGILPTEDIVCFTKFLFFQILRIQDCIQVKGQSQRLTTLEEKEVKKLDGLIISRLIAALCALQDCVQVKAQTASKVYCWESRYWIKRKFTEVGVATEGKDHIFSIWGF